ncbi:MAG: helix-turn-helix domain-containing protein, partial [Pseudomonadota bacterium]
ALWSSEAATNIGVCVFQHAIAECLMRECPRFRRVISREADYRRQQIVRSAWQLNAPDSRERITAFLVDATRFMPTKPQPDGSLIVTIEISRRDWADLTNTAVETVCRTMRYLADKRIVDIVTPSRFLIRDLDRLAFLAGIDPPRPIPDQRCLPVGPEIKCA